MHIPSEKIHRSMRSNDSGVWIVPANDGRELAILVKAPTACLKAIMAGCSLSLVVAVEEGVFCTGVRIFDVPGAPVLLCNVAKQSEDKAMLLRFAGERMAPIFLFNELDACVAWSNASIEEVHGSSLQALNFPGTLTTDDLGEHANSVMDRFCQSIDSSFGRERLMPIVVTEIPMALEFWRVNKNSYVSGNSFEHVVLDGVDEGGTLESAVWAAMEAVFPDAVHRGPQVKVGLKLRELVDVLTHHEYGTFLIEAKDLAVFSATAERGRERRAAGIVKQAKKAITQLIGASKAVRRGDKIVDAKGTSISPTLSQPMHCIVLLTDLMHDGDWSEVAEGLCDAMTTTGEFFHVLDLRELVHLLKASQGKATHFDYFLIERCKLFVEHRNVHMRVRVVAK